MCRNIGVERRRLAANGKRLLSLTPVQPANTTTITEPQVVSRIFAIG
jgi:hypothetical protein